jgi:5-methylcytosine-specific restriction endonuclease McrA
VTALPRRPLRGRSPKQTALYVLRRKLVAEILRDRPWCEIRWSPEVCEGRAVDVDEFLSRAQGGSILEVSNLQATCRPCHDAKHGNPAEAVDRGFTIQRRASS